MKENIKFSIISPNRNNEKWIKEHIDSIKAQTYTNYEHIIIDDVSSDNSIKMIESNADFSKTKVFRREGRVLSLRNHMLGFKQMVGDIVVTLDCDDYLYDSNVLQRIADVYKDTKCWATYGSWVHRDDRIKWGMLPHPTGVAEDVRKLKAWYFTHLRTFRKEMLSAMMAMDLFDSYGNLQEYAPDVSMLTGIYEYALKHDKVVYIDTPLVVYNSNTGHNECPPGNIVASNRQSMVLDEVFNSEYSPLKLI